MLAQHVPALGGDRCMEPGDLAVLLLGPQSAGLKMGILGISPCEFSEVCVLGGQTGGRNLPWSLPHWYPPRGRGGDSPQPWGQRRPLACRGNVPATFLFFFRWKKWRKDLTPILPLPSQAPRVQECSEQPPGHKPKSASGEIEQAARQLVWAPWKAPGCSWSRHLGGGTRTGRQSTWLTPPERSGESATRLLCQLRPVALLL